MSILFLCIAINDSLALIFQGGGNIKEYQVILYTVFLFFQYLLSIYGVRFILYPRYLLHKKYALFLILSSIWIFLMALLEWGVSRFTINYFDIPISSLEGINPTILLVLDIASLFIMHMTACIAILTPKFLQKWTIEKQQVVQIENQQLITHLNQLKELLNPDFLFNILHKISDLEKTDSEKASEMVIKLSQLLRYQLYECQKEKVFLSSETRFIINYLELEKLYYKDFNYKIVSPPSSHPLLVPPLLFVNLIQEILEENEQTCMLKELSLQFLYNESKVIFICSANQSGNFLNKNYESFRKRLRLLLQDKYLLEIRKSDATIYLEIEI